jgi:hypothetical protein
MAVFLKVFSIRGQHSNLFLQRLQEFRCHALPALACVGKVRPSCICSRSANMAVLSTTRINSDSISVYNRLNIDTIIIAYRFCCDFQCGLDKSTIACVWKVCFPRIENIAFHVKLDLGGRFLY